MVDIRFITDDEVPAFHRAVPFGFGDDLTEDDGAHDRFRDLFPLETCIGAFEDGRVVGTFGSFDFELTVPGGAVPMAGTTIVTVQPTHRRQGVLRTMMRMHLEQAVDRGQPIAGLWASETPIYGRFGYGMAAGSQHLTVPTDRVSLPPGPDTDVVRLIDPDDAMDILPDIYERVRLATPGMWARSEPWWRHRCLRDPEHWRDGASSRRIAVVRRGDDAVGYVAYRQKEKWEGGVPAGTVMVIEVIAVDDDARRSLWDYLAHIDLFPTVEWWNAPMDYPLSLEVDFDRRITRKPGDALWLNLLDIPTALSARTYESDGVITFEITDAFLGRAGSYRLTIEGGRGECEPTDDAPDLTLSVRDLSAMYLGLPSAMTRWHAGRLEGPESAVRLLDRLLRTSSAPFCNEVF